jgi:hypothetical protein
MQDTINVMPHYNQNRAENNPKTMSRLFGFPGSFRFDGADIAVIETFQVAEPSNIEFGVTQSRAHYVST